MLVVGIDSHIQTTLLFILHFSRFVLWRIFPKLISSDGSLPFKHLLFLIFGPVSKPLFPQIQLFYDLYFNTLKLVLYIFSGLIYESTKASATKQKFRELRRNDIFYQLTTVDMDIMHRGTKIN